MKIYLKLIFGCIFGIIIVDIVLALLGLAIFIWTIYDIIKNILSFIFHPIKFFKEKKEEKKFSLKDYVGFDWKDFIDTEKDSEVKKKSNSFVDMLNEELAKMKKNKHQYQNNGDYSEDNIQIGNINIKGE